jgi:hypothetical protein
LVPHSYLAYMITAAGAAGAMIGLLFVAVSMRSDLVFGKNAPPKIKTLAGSSFTGLVNAFSLSLLAIVPNTNIGAGMVVLAVACLYYTWSLHASTLKITKQYRVLALSMLTYTAQGVGGVTLLVRPHLVHIIGGLCYVIFASFAISLARAWALIQSESAPVAP